MSRADAFSDNRRLLFTIAYEMLGLAADAEDVVQDTWIRWQRVDATTVREPKAYLAQITTRLSLNRLRTLKRRRETYVGPWLPEPLLTAPDVLEDVELADAVSTAMLLVLDTLGPVERAVFVLREVFDFGYPEIAAAVGKSEPAVRQVAHRARSHVQARRPRQRPSAAEQEAVVRRFARAAADGDIQSLLDAMSPDVVLLTDGGGKRTAARRPIVGRDAVLRFLGGLSEADLDAPQITHLNGAPALRIMIAGELDTVASLLIEDGVVTALYLVRNPDKLHSVTTVTDLLR